MNKLEVTWWRATKIWWSLLWRSMLYVVLISIPIGFFIGIIAAALNITDQMAPYYNLIGAIIGIPVGICVIKIVLSKQFSDFQIILIPSYESILDAEKK